MRASDRKWYEAFEAAGFHDLAQRAKAGEFNEFFGEHATPEMFLADELNKRKHDETLPNHMRIAAHHLRVRLINGEFDAGVEESEEWAKSPEGQEVFGRLSRGE